jgi:YD repeat-containing protein
MLSRRDYGLPTATKLAVADKEANVSSQQVIYLPEAVVEDLLGKRLPASVGIEFDYNGQRYRVRQRDPLRMEGEVPCEPIDPLPDSEQDRKRSRRR